MIDKDDTKKAYVSEAVEKIPNKNKKYRKRSSCVIVCIATIYQ